MAGVLRQGFFPPGEARATSISRSGSVTDEQRRHSPISQQPAGRQLFFPQTSLLTPYGSISGYARRSRLVCGKNFLPRKLTDLGDTTLAVAAFDPHELRHTREDRSPFRSDS